MLLLSLTDQPSECFQGSALKELGYFSGNAKKVARLVLDGTKKRNSSLREDEG